MQALVKFQNGDGFLRVQEMPAPQIRPGHVIIRVEACGICGTDLHILAGEYPVNPPVTLGHEFSGVIVASATEVSSFHIGDRVVSMPYFTLCGKCRFCKSGQWNLCPWRVSAGSGTNGGFAEYVLMPERGLFRVPDKIELSTAAVIEPLACCVHGILELTHLTPADLVLVVGPGPIGLLALEVARAAGARTAICGTHDDEKRLALARTLGADYTWDVQQTDVVKNVREVTNGDGADIVLECSGAGAGAALGMQAVRRGGQFTQLGLFGKPLQADLDQLVYKEVKLHGSFASTWTSWKKALDLVSTGCVQLPPIISDILPLGQWETAFARCRARDGLKVLLLPQSLA